MEKELRTVDLSEWVLFSARRNSNNYLSKDKKWMLKTVSKFADGSLEGFQREYDIANKVLESGILTPKVEEIVKVSDSEYGLIFEYLKDKVSFARIMSEDVANIPSYIKEMAEAAKKIHSVDLDESKFSNMHDLILKYVEDIPLYDDLMKSKIKKALALIPRMHKACEIDFNPGNFIRCNNKIYLIDLGMFCCGNPILDVANFAFFTRILPPFLASGTLRATPQNIELMWHDFLKAYFDLKTEEEIKEKDRLMCGYVCISMIAIIGVVKPDGHEFDEFFQNKFHPWIDYLISELEKK